MNKITILFLFCSFSAFAQKTYQFDHILEYEFWNKPIPDSIPSKEYWLTNSKDNSYLMIAAEIGNDSVFIRFTDRKKRFHGGFKVKTSEMLEEAVINLPCAIFHRVKGEVQQIRQNNFTEVIDSTVHQKKYVVKNKKQRKEKRKNLNRTYFHLYPGSQAHQPTFESTMHWEVWNKEKNVPYGIFNKIYAVSAKGDTTLIHTLKKVYIMDKKANLPEDCNPEFRLRINGIPVY